MVFEMFFSYISRLFSEVCISKNRISIYITSILAGLGTCFTSFGMEIHNVENSNLNEMITEAWKNNSFTNKRFKNHQLYLDVSKVYKQNRTINPWINLESTDRFVVFKLKNTRKKKWKRYLVPGQMGLSILIKISENKASKLYQTGFIVDRKRQPNNSRYQVVSATLQSKVTS